MTLQELLQASMYNGWGSPPSGLPSQQPVPFASSPPVNAMKRAFNYITATPQPKPDMAPFINNAQANFGQPNVGPVKALLPSLMAGSGASTATPTQGAPQAPTAPVPLPQPRPVMRPTPVAGPPMNIVPPGVPAPNASPSGYNPGLSAVSGAAEGNGNPSDILSRVPMFGPMLGLFGGLANTFGQRAPGYSPGWDTPPPQGILPKFINDLSAMKRAFAGSGPSASDNAIS